VLKAFKFGPWLPDIAQNPNVTTAQNVIPIEGGYAPVPGFSGVTTALASTFVGGAAYVGSDGTSALLSATPAGLYKYSGSAWNSLLSLSTSSRWRFTQFGDNVIYANGGTLGSYGIISGTAAAISGAPTATDVATVRDFVMAIGINGNKELAGWSAFNDSSSWPMDGTTNQSDQQPLPDGGEAVAIVGGEYGIILQKKAVRRVTYVGGDVIFQIDVISHDVGCMAQGSVANADRMIFFLSERGFMMCDGENVIPIAEEKFNRWFFSTYSRQDIANIWAAIDPRRSLVMWAMPGTPGRIICYNWVLKAASVISIDVAGLFTGFTANTSIDALGNIDTLGTSLDDPIYQGGNPLLLLVNSSNIIGTLAGDNLEATVTLSNVEPSPGVRSRIRSLRLVSDTTSASATINAKMRQGDGESSVSAATMRLNGKMPIRSNGRYNDITATIPASATWNQIQGVELEFEAGDGR
jgi:hypothetical protein